MLTTLYHEGKPIQSTRDDWQTRARGTNKDEYDTYVYCLDDGKGNDVTTGQPLKTFDEWLNS